MASFSQCIADMVGRTLRPDLQVEMQGYVNSTIRELHSDSRTGSLLLFGANRVELQLTADSASAYVWEIVNPRLFAKMEAVNYTTLNQPAFERTPSNIVGNRGKLSTHYYYRTGDAWAFNDYGGINALIDISYFVYLGRKFYYATGEDPATYDLESETWTYLPAYDVSDAQRLVARGLSSNWMLERHYECVVSGAIAKLHARLGDMDRSRPAFAQFKTLQKALVGAETFSSGSVTRL